MPHYVLELKRTSRTPDGGFAVYSTIVDNLITPPMSAEEMKAYLVDRDYSSWLQKEPDTKEVLIEKYGEDLGTSMFQWQEATQQWYYWHEEQGFTYAKEQDAYFCLPRSMWRYE
jgi:hypothetical protein